MYGVSVKLCLTAARLERKLGHHLHNGETLDRFRCQERDGG